MEDFIQIGCCARDPKGLALFGLFDRYPDRPKKPEPVGARCKAGAQKN